VICAKDPAAIKPVNSVRTICFIAEVLDFKTTAMVLPLLIFLLNEPNEKGAVNGLDKWLMLLCSRHQNIH
jgi:hypothetical protein